MLPDPTIEYASTAQTGLRLLLNKTADLSEMDSAELLTFQQDFFSLFINAAKNNFFENFKIWDQNYHVIQKQLKFLEWKLQNKSDKRRLQYQSIFVAAEFAFQKNFPAEAIASFYLVIQLFSGDFPNEEGLITAFICSRFLELKQFEKAHLLFDSLQLASSQNSDSDSTSVEIPVRRLISLGQPQKIPHDITNPYELKLLAVFEKKDWQSYFIFCNTEAETLNSEQIFTGKILNFYSIFAGLTNIPLKSSLQKKIKSQNYLSKQFKVFQAIEEYCTKEFDHSSPQDVTKIFSDLETIVRNPLWRITLEATLAVKFGRNNQSIMYEFAQSNYRQNCEALTRGINDNLLHLKSFNLEFGITGVWSKKLHAFFQVSKLAKVERQARFAQFIVTNSINFASIKLLLAFSAKSQKERRTKNYTENLSYSVLLQAANLKGLAVKILQFLSQSGDAIPEGVKKIFQNLQSNSTMLETKSVKNILQAENIAPDILSTLSQIPIAQASLGQVHSANWEGLPVAVKIQFPDMAEFVRDDLNVLKVFLPFLKLLFNSSDVDHIFDYLAGKFSDECDYEIEARYQQIAFDALTTKKLPNVFIPKVFAIYSSKKVMLTELSHGEDFQWFLANASQQQKNKAGSNIFTFIMSLLLQDGFLYCDIHPGNFLFTLETLTVVDFGHCQIFSAEQKNCLNNLFNSFIFDNFALFKQAMMAFGSYDQSSKFDFEHEFINLKEYVVKPFLTDGPFTFNHNFAAIAARKSFVDSPNLYHGRIHAENSALIRLFHGLYQILAQLEAEISTRYLLLEVLQINKFKNVS